MTAVLVSETIGQISSKCCPYRMRTQFSLQMGNNVSSYCDVGALMMLFVFRLHFAVIAHCKGCCLCWMLK